jgi:hypothetical protein
MKSENPTPTNSTDPKKRPLSDSIRLLRDVLKLSVDLFKIMIPVIVVVKILQELGLITFLALPLGPLMNLVGLPAEMGLVWATAMLNNLYSAIVVLLSLIKEAPLSAAQATVLCTMMLVAHTLPIELKIAQISGPRLMFQALCRLSSALLLGWLLHFVYSRFALLQEPARMLIGPHIQTVAQKESLAQWALGQAQNLVSIFFIILALFLLMRALRKLRIIDAMNRVLRPLLKLMGIGPKASAITVIGLTMGISYGGGLIIHEARLGGVHKKDVFYSLTLMGLSHALIEDTLLMIMAGGHISGIFWARLAFSLVAITLLVKISSRLPAPFCDRFLWGPPK